MSQTRLPHLNAKLETVQGGTPETDNKLEVQDYGTFQI